MLMARTRAVERTWRATLLHTGAVSNEGSPLVQGTDRPWRDFAVGAIGAAIVLLLACEAMAPRSPQLAALGQAVLGVASALVAVGVVLCAARATRPLVWESSQGSASAWLAWSALIATSDFSCADSDERRRP